MNPFYTSQFSVIPGTRVDGPPLEEEFERIEEAFDGVSVDVDDANQGAINAGNSALAAQASAQEASDAALSASASAALALQAVNAAPFVPGQVYQAAADTVISLVDLQNYRRRTTGSGATDPANDPTNWEKVGGVSVIDDPYFWM